MLRRDNALFAVDLWLDVLVRCDGCTYGVYAEDDFDEATRRSWLSRREAASARAGLRALVALIERQQLVGFLAAVHPFGPAATPAAPENAAGSTQKGDRHVDGALVQRFRSATANSGRRAGRRRDERGLETCRSVPRTT